VRRHLFIVAAGADSQGQRPGRRPPLGCRRARRRRAGQSPCRGGSAVAKAGWSLPPTTSPRTADHLEVEQLGARCRRPAPREFPGCHRDCPT
jgi:hypothetical protein